MRIRCRFIEPFLEHRVGDVIEVSSMEELTAI